MSGTMQAEATQAETTQAETTRAETVSAEIRLDEIPFGEGRTVTVGEDQVAVFRLRPADDDADGEPLVRAVSAGEPLRDYGDTGTVADLIVLLIEIVSVGLRHWIKPGWTIGMLLDRPRRPTRLVHKERLPRTADPTARVTELCQRLTAGWRPKNLQL